jgi:hypothetical protein
VSTPIPEKPVPAGDVKDLKGLQVHQQTFGQIGVAVACLQLGNDATLPFDAPCAFGHAPLSLRQSFLQVCPGHADLTPVRRRRFAFCSDHVLRSGAHVRPPYLRGLIAGTHRMWNPVNRRNDGVLPELSQPKHLPS